jgi:hypothetical protein
MFNGAIRRNPTDLDCWKSCLSCFRCEDKGKYDKCNRCSGRSDEELRKEPHDIDDRCRCKEGILQVRTQKGQLVQAKMPSDPFAGVVKHDPRTQDESDWQAYLDQQRERLNDPYWDPVAFEDGSSTNDWTEQQRGGA